jgi:hypothetical protein
MFDAALDAHPQALLVGIAGAALIVMIVIAFLMDLFVGRAERDSKPAAPGAKLPSSAELMTAHRAVVHRHGRGPRVDAR